MALENSSKEIKMGNEEKQTLREHLQSTLGGTAKDREILSQKKEAIEEMRRIGGDGIGSIAMVGI